MSVIIDWLKEPSSKGDYEKYFIEFKDKTHIKVENVEEQLIKDGFFILESKHFGSIMFNVNDIKAVYTNLLVCEEYKGIERRGKHEKIQMSIEKDKLKALAGNTPKVSRIS